MKRNVKRAAFKAHLFADADVAAAGGADNEPSDSPVESVCNQAESYGPFHDVSYESARAAADADRGGDAWLCRTCVISWHATRRDDAEPGTEPGTEANDA